MSPLQTFFGLAATAVLIDLAIRLIALVVVPRNRLPTAAMAWLLAIFFIPVIGVLLYLLIGSPKLPADRRRKQVEMNGIIADESKQAVPPNVDRAPEWLDSVVKLTQNRTAMPLVGGNAAGLIDDYAGSLAAMATEVDTATSFVHVEFYILSSDQATAGFFDSLEAAVSRGVTVRVLLDHWASSHCRDYKATLQRLTALGARWELMLPVQPLHGRYQRLDLRNHRKLLVVDGRVGFIGSQNLIDRSYNKKKNLKRGLQWQELMCRIIGPVVASIDLVFATDWYMETGERLVPAPTQTPGVGPGDLECQVVPSGPGFPIENNLQLFLSLLYSARDRIIITSPYFVPDDSMLRGLLAATGRGVHVELFVSEIGDQGLVWHAQRSYYQALLEAGVQIFCYPAPFILHAKHFSIDDEVAVIGSSNMDMRSFGLNSEISLMVHSKSFVAEMRTVELAYRTISKPLTLAEWLKEPRSATVRDGLARLTSALQ
ncbi:MAG: cardiolipin synthase [Actinomycetes bacterium]